MLQNAQTKKFITSIPFIDPINSVLNLSFYVRTTILLLISKCLLTFLQLALESCCLLSMVSIVTFVPPSLLCTGLLWSGASSRNFSVSFPSTCMTWYIIMKWYPIIGNADVLKLPISGKKIYWSTGSNILYVSYIALPLNVCSDQVDVWWIHERKVIPVRKCEDKPVWR